MEKTIKAYGKNVVFRNDTDYRIKIGVYEDEDNIYLIVEDSIKSIKNKEKISWKAREVKF